MALSVKPEMPNCPAASLYCLAIGSRGVKRVPNASNVISLGMFRRMACRPISRGEAGGMVVASDAVSRSWRLVI